MSHRIPTRALRRAAVAVVVLAAAAVRAAGSNPNETVDTTPTPADLAQALVGPGVAIENVTYTGAADARGSFAFVDPTVVGVAQGVVLSSGNAHDVVGPNTSDSFSTDWTNPGDADLSTLAGYPTFDAAVLEFDFTPDANQVAFQYAFASDEYSEWVNTPYNDVFAFFVNGTNCAVVREVAGDPMAPFVPVAVNNINDSNPVQVPPPPPVRPDLFRANAFVDGGVSPIDLEQDGVTRVITCQAAVTPGQTNHMKLAIADASDGVWDSAVFIQAGSLVSNENPTADLGLDPSDGAAPLQVTATIEGHDPNGLALTYVIDWGDGTTSPSADLPETATATHTYVSGGEYVVTLTVSNGTLSGTDHDDVHVTGGSGSTTTTTAAPTTTTATASTTTTTTSASTTETTATVTTTTTTTDTLATTTTATTSTTETTTTTTTTVVTSTTTTTTSTTEPTTSTTETTTSTTESTTSTTATTTTTTTIAVTTTTLAALCAPTPAIGCRQAAPGTASLLLKDDPVDGRDQLSWSWGKGAETPLDAFGDPVHGTPTYRLCLYDASPGVQPLAVMAVPAGGTCGKRPCWKATGTSGFAYDDRSGTPDGIMRAKLKAGPAGKAAVQLSGRGEALPLPALGLALPVTVQLVVDRGAGVECWQTTFGTATRNDARQLKARGP